MVQLSLLSFVVPVFTDTSGCPLTTRKEPPPKAETLALLSKRVCEIRKETSGSRTLSPVRSSISFSANIELEEEGINDKRDWFFTKKFEFSDNSKLSSEQDENIFYVGKKIPSELPAWYRKCTIHVNLTPTGFGDKVTW